MLALKQLLEELDVGGGGEARHRCLIFAQLKQTLDIIENDVLGRHLQNLSFMRLDGSVPSHDRFAVQQKFNSDVTIDLLLLQTSVGGLGLNLTGADTVIFVEHDWNPSKDLQALYTALKPLSL
jgi:TATA-binding protein-associated factor